MALGAIAAFTTLDGRFFWEIAIISIIFGLVCLPCISIWTLFAYPPIAWVRSVSVKIKGVAIAGLGGVVIIVLTAALLTATIIWTNKQQATSTAEAAETQARTILNNAYTEDGVAACLANAPC